MDELVWTRDDLINAIAERLYEGTQLATRDLIEPFANVPEKSKQFYRDRAIDVLDVVGSPPERTTPQSVAKEWPYIGISVILFIVGLIILAKTR